MNSTKVTYGKEQDEPVGELYGRTRLYVVAAVSENTNAFGLEGVVLVRRNGEAWEVGRSRYAGLATLKKGDVVKVAQMHTEGAKPSFHHCEIPRPLPAAPKAVVKELWAAAEGDPVCWM